MADLTTIIELVGRDNGASRAAREVSSSLDGLTSSAGRSNAALAVGATALGALVVAAGAAAAAVSALGLAFNAQKEQATIAFTTMIGSADAAKQHIADLTNFAKTTPFQLGGLIETSQRVQALGFDVKTVIPLLTTIGDAAAGLSLGQEGINRITLALGQMAAKGKATGEELRQLTEAGIPALRFIAEGIGKTQAETSKLIEAGAVSSNTAIHFILEGMESRFGGLMEKQSHSLMGLLSNLQDFAQQLSGTIMEPVFVRLKTGLEGLTTAMAGPEFQAGVQKMSTILNVALDVAGQLIEKLRGPVGKAFAQVSSIAESAFGGDMKTASEKLTTLLAGWAKTISGWVGEAWEGLKSGLLTIGTALLTWVTKTGLDLKEMIDTVWVPAFKNWVENAAKPKLAEEIDKLQNWFTVGEGKTKTQQLGEAFGINIMKGFTDSLPAGGLRDYLSKSWAKMGEPINIGGMNINAFGGVGGSPYGPSPAYTNADTLLRGQTMPGGGLVPGSALTLQDQARSFAIMLGIDPDIFVRQIQQESGFNAAAVSPAGARGIGQFMPGTATGVARQMRGVGIEVTGEEIMGQATTGLLAAAFHMNQLLNEFGGNYASALSAYNAGQGATPRGGIAPWPETQRYVSSILGESRPMRGGGEGSTPPGGGMSLADQVNAFLQGKLADMRDELDKITIPGLSGPSAPGPKGSETVQADAPFRLSSTGFLKSFIGDLSTGMGEGGVKIMQALQKAIETESPATEKELGNAAAAMIAQLADNAPPEQAAEWIGQIMDAIQRATDEKTPEATAAVGDLLSAVNFNLPLAKLGDDMATHINQARDQAFEQITSVTEKTQQAIEKLESDQREGFALRSRIQDFTEAQKTALDAEIAHVGQLKTAYHDMREEEAAARQEQRAADDLKRTRDQEDLDRIRARAKEDADFRRSNQPRGTEQLGTGGIVNRATASPFDDRLRQRREQDAEIVRQRGDQDKEIERRSKQAATDRVDARTRREEDREWEKTHVEEPLDKFRRFQAEALRIFNDGIADKRLKDEIIRLTTAKDEAIAKANERMDLVEKQEIIKWEAAKTRQNALNTLADHYLQSLQEAELIQAGGHGSGSGGGGAERTITFDPQDPNRGPTITGNGPRTSGPNITINNPNFVGPGGMDDAASFLQAATSRKVTIARLAGL